MLGKRLGLGCVVLLALAATPAWAISTFDQFDRNHDGRITRDEYESPLRFVGLFARHDLDHDGVIEQSEFEAMGVPGRYGDFATWDGDDDGRITPREFLHDVHSAFDADGNGRWAESEWKAARAADWL
ncbi:MAG: EF-hand domain-containing protein [Myxococcota bacterium]